MRNPIKIQGIYPFYDQIISGDNRIRRILFRFVPFPLHTVYPLLYETYLVFVRLVGLLMPLRYINSKDLLVNVASGPYGRRGWINIDAQIKTGVNCLYDCRKRLPFQDNSVKGIFCEHFFEHLDYTEEVPYFISECYRVLQPGGVVRLIVPDMERYFQGYCTEGWNDLAKIRPLDGGRVDHYFGCEYRTRMELINVVARQGYQHKYMYDYETLAFVFYRYGFSYVTQKAFQCSMMDELCIDLEERASESLYFEARK